jgi:DNA-binding LacI/PurR family transcriptional regulator
MVTIQELSKLCGVSVSTVSKALNGYSDISDKTRDLVIKTANDMGYFPNANARALKLKKTYNIGVLFNTLQNIGLKNEYFAHILEAFKEEAAQEGYDITFIEHYIGRRKMTYLEHCQYRHFDGVCIMCADYENEEVVRLVNSDIPVLTIDYAFQKAYSIISDNYGGMKQLVNYILRQGHTDIAYIYGVNSLVTRNRVDSFLDTMEENGLTVPQEYLRESLYRNMMMAEEHTMKLLQLPNRPTCIIAPDDTSAMGVVSAVRKNGLQIVRDISIAGYDGIDSTQFIGIKLATVRQERDAIGRQAAKKLIEMIEKNGEVPLDTVFMKQTLLAGNSVKKLN